MNWGEVHREGLFVRITNLSVNILSHLDAIHGRFLKVGIRAFVFAFYNIYAPFVFKEKLVSVAQGDCTVLGGDWNCCIDALYEITRPHPLSSGRF